ncbi:MAG: tripartite tricarboxylate transporter substrate binding protein [Burkholderiales bacterium]|nr:tripartite tricarboxylate transporter substrate binding protein [Burkholderiales bacterium]
MTIGVAPPTHAAWPDDSPIKLIVPQAAGGTNDTVARLIGVSLGKVLKQSIVVENRPGAAGAIGMQALAQAKPDGYTLGIASDSAAMLDAVRPAQNWSFKRDIAGVAMVGDQPISITVSAKTQYRTLAEVVKDAKARPGQVAFGTSGIGTSQHVVGEWFARLADVSITHIPYKGGGQASGDLVGGQVPMAVLGLAPMLQQHKRGTVRIVAVTTPKRNAALPDVPTLTELGYPQIALSQWVGVVAPAGTPPAVVARLSDEMVKIVDQPEVRKSLADSGIDPRPMTSAQFGKFLEAEVNGWIKLIPTLKLKLD